MTKKLLIILGFYCIATLPIFAQFNVCGSDELHSLIGSTPEDSILRDEAFRGAIHHWRQQNPGPHSLPNPISAHYKMTGSPQCPRTDYIIPVVIHIVHHTNDSVGQGANITDAQVLNQMEILNNIFANQHGTSVNTGIQFVLAQQTPNNTATTGILRLANNNFVSMVKTNANINSFFATYNWDESRYLNIYVVNDIRDSNGDSTDIGGFASYPWDIGRGRQGIVMRYDYIGHKNFGSPVNPISEGHLLAHEVAHYFGVRHPWDGGCVPNDTSICAIRGDMCCDVP